jgi:pimeloyl-ACP methyl ester carboxylesterase
MGDYLDKHHNALAINMALLPTRSSEASGHVNLTNKVVVLIHGLTNLETVWNFPLSTEDNYGTRLQDHAGFTPFYLRYNTGLNIEENGRNFAQKLEALVEDYPMDIEELVLIGFSMGGLVARYAQMDGIEKSANWLAPLTHCIYVGSPHEGSPLEKFGHLASAVVREFPKDYINHWADWIDVRSEGIQNLKDGLADKYHPNLNTEHSETQCGSFYKHAQHSFISGGLSPKVQPNEEPSWVTKLLGDSLVRTTSALPKGAPENSQSQHFDHIPHIPLAHSNRVYGQIQNWLSSSNSTQTCSKEYSLEELRFIDSLSEQDLTKQKLTSHSLELGAEGFKHSVNAIKTTHIAIADEPFGVLSKIPVVSPFAKGVELMHHGISKGTYEAVGLGSHLIKAAARLTK